MTAPLAGLRVIEAANFLAGPFAGMILADLGADVIKIEPPRGDPYRRVGRPYGDASLQFRATNQNKQTVVLDLKSDTGRERLFQLLADADVLLTNWRPGAAERLGLVADEVRRDFPQLVWVRVSGYGPDGPRHEQPAYDSIVQARSGIQLLGTTSPLNTNNNVADKVSAMFAAQTITAAIVARDRNGTGSVCDVAMTDAMAYFYGADAASGHRIADRPADEAVGAQMITELTMPTAVGHIALSPVTGRQLRRALETVGAGDRFAELMDADRADTMTVFRDLVGPPLLERSAVEWEAAFGAADVPAAAVRTFDEHIADEQTLHNRVYIAVPDAGIDGEWLLVRFPALFDGVAAETAGRPAPSLPSENADT